MASAQRRNVSYNRRVHRDSRNRNSAPYQKSNELYIYDNTVRQSQVEEYIEIERTEYEQREINRRNRKERETAIFMNRSYVLYLICAVCVVFAATSYFLSLSADVASHKATVVDLKTQIIDLKSENDEYERRLEMSINIDSVRNTAINELGMVYPAKSQIVNYEYEESDYVRQYAEVPQE